MSRRIVGPFNRVEGDLEVQLDIQNDQVADAWVVSSLFRGFEQILAGKPPMDALVYTPRICGICSVSQSVAAAAALADLQGLRPMPQGEIATNLILANENVADHLTHFYLFFMPDFTREIYKECDWYASACRRFEAVKGTATQEVLPARANFMHVMGILAGKWPHSLAIQPGGTTRAVEAKEKLRLQSIVFQFKNFLERVLFGDILESIVSLSSEKELLSWSDRFAPTASDFNHFLHIADSLGLNELGISDADLLSYGAYQEADGRRYDAGYWMQDSDDQQGSSNTGVQAVDHALIAEDVSHSWSEKNTPAAHPWEGNTVPDMTNESAYSWCKAPRMAGRVVEVGAFARQSLDQHPLILDLLSKRGSNVRTRVIARLLEVARVVLDMEAWVKALQPKEAFCAQSTLPDSGRGVGLVEAARGSLGHWIAVENGKIKNYQIIAPTTWNFSPRDEQGVRGALEQALIGAPVQAGEKTPVSVQHIVRSFDPCMVCTVH